MSEERQAATDATDETKEAPKPPEASQDTETQSETAEGAVEGAARGAAESPEKGDSQEQGVGDDDAQGKDAVRARDDEDDETPDDPYAVDLEDSVESGWLREAEVAALEERLDKVEIATIGQDETIAEVQAKEIGHRDKVRMLELSLRDERILEIARGMEDYLHRVQDTHASLRATLDQQSSGSQDAWRLVAIITLVAWILVGAALAVPDVRVTIGRSLLTEREQLMIELVEEAWKRDAARQAVEEGGHDGA